MSAFLIFISAILVMLASVAFSTGLVTLFVSWIYQHKGRSKRSLLLIGLSLVVAILAAVLTVGAIDSLDDGSSADIDSCFSEVYGYIC